MVWMNEGDARRQLRAGERVAHLVPLSSYIIVTEAEAAALAGPFGWEVSPLEEPTRA